MELRRTNLIALAWRHIDDVPTAASITAALYTLTPSRVNITYDWCFDRGLGSLVLNWLIIPDTHFYYKAPRDDSVWEDDYADNPNEQYF